MSFIFYQKYFLLQNGFKTFLFSCDDIQSHSSISIVPPKPKVLTFRKHNGLSSTGSAIVLWKFRDFMRIIAFADFELLQTVVSAINFPSRHQILILKLYERHKRGLKISFSFATAIQFRCDIIKYKCVVILACM